MDGGDDDDLAPTALDHAPPHLTRDEKDAAHLGRHQRVEIGCREVRQRRPPLHTRVVDEDVHGPDLGEPAAYVGLVGDIEGNGPHSARSEFVEFGPGRLQRLRTPGVEDNLRPRLDEGPRERLADALAAAGH